MIRIGVGGWTYAPWRGGFYPPGLPQKQELAHAASRLASIEINGTFYSTFKPDSWARWRDQVPDGFVFAVKASRYCTNRRVLASMGEAMDKFLGQGLTLLGDKLGPINWQLADTKAFDAEDVAAFLALLPAERDGVALRHAIEVRHPSFCDERFYDLAAAHNVAIVHADDPAHPDRPGIDRRTAPFTYARLMRTTDDTALGLDEATLAELAARLREQAADGDVFAYVIAGAKHRNPLAAEALARQVAA